MRSNTTRNWFPAEFLASWWYFLGVYMLLDLLYYITLSLHNKEIVFGRIVWFIVVWRENVFLRRCSFISVYSCQKRRKEMSLFLNKLGIRLSKHETCWQGWLSLVNWVVPQASRYIFLLRNKSKTALQLLSLVCRAISLWHFLLQISMT